GAVYKDYIETGKTVAEVALSLADAGTSYTAILKGKSVNPREDMLRVTSALKQTLLSVSELEVEQSLPEPYAHQLSSLKEPFEKMGGIIDVLPQLTGVGQEQRYLVLFQNNMELRPGGG